MAIAFDAESLSAVDFNGDESWTHTPVGTPKGVLVLIAQQQLSDQIAGVTYGGQALSRVALNLAGAGAEDGTLYAYFLGSGLPTGAQTVAIDVAGGTSAKVAAALTVTADGDTEVEDFQTLDSASASNPSVTLATGIGIATFIAGCLWSGQGVTAVAPGTDYTEVVESDGGLNARSIQRRTNIASGGNVTCDWITTAADEAGIVAVAIREAAAAGGGGRSHVIDGGLASPIFGFIVR